MPQSYFTMWATLFLLAFGALGGALIHGDVFGSIRAAYPADTARRDALHRCGQMDAEFSRFSEHDREVCYRAIMPVSAQVSSSGAPEW
jgi:hypothetical protein